jgi:hypothetical protein
MGAITGGVDNSTPNTGTNAFPNTAGCGTTQLACFSGLSTTPVTHLVATSVAMQAFADAATLSADARALPATSPITSIGANTVIQGNGGLNVINVGSVTNPFSGTTGVLMGGPNDLFIINVSGSFSSNQAMKLQGVTASQILWNFTGTGTVLNTSGGNTLYGTFLSTTNGARFQADALNVTGALINTGGHIEFVSGANLTFDPFIVPQQEMVPEPDASSLLLFGMGLVAGVGALCRKLRLNFAAAP